MQATKNNHHLYSKHLKKYARANRKQMTKAEACLWKYVLKAKQTGYTFNRQRPVLNYIADFMCKELRLIIEVDGYTHLLEDVIMNNKIREGKLKAADFTILRFKDEEVLKEIDAVKNKIVFVIKELENNLVTEICKHRL